MNTDEEKPSTEGLANIQDDSPSPYLPKGLSTIDPYELCMQETLAREAAELAALAKKTNHQPPLPFKDQHPEQPPQLDKRINSFSSVAKNAPEIPPYEEKQEDTEMENHDPPSSYNLFFIFFLFSCCFEIQKITVKNSKIEPANTMYLSRQTTIDSQMIEGDLPKSPSCSNNLHRQSSHKQNFEWEEDSIGGPLPQSMSKQVQSHVPPPEEGCCCCFFFFFFFLF